MRPLGITQSRQVQFCVGENLALSKNVFRSPIPDDDGRDPGTHLVCSSELKIDTEVLLVERL